MMLVYQTLAACGPQAVKPIENAVKKVKELQRNAMAASEAIAASGFEAPSVQNQLATLSRAEALFTRLLDDPKIEK